MPADLLLSTLATVAENLQHCAELTFVVANRRRPMAGLLLSSKRRAGIASAGIVQPMAFVHHVRADQTEGKRLCRSGV